MDSFIEMKTRNKSVEKWHNNNNSNNNSSASRYRLTRGQSWSWHPNEAEARVRKAFFSDNDDGDDVVKKTEGFSFEPALSALQK